MADRRLAEGIVSRLLMTFSMLLIFFTSSTLQHMYFALKLRHKSANMYLCQKTLLFKVQVIFSIQLSSGVWNLALAHLGELAYFARIAWCSRYSSY